MDSVRFCTWAPLLVNYPGALAARVAPARPKPRPEPVYTTPVPPPQLTPPGAVEIPSTQAAVRLSPMSQLFSFATAGG